MKPIILAIFFLAVIIVGSLASAYYITNEAEALHKQLSQLEKNIDEEKWQQAGSLYKDLDERWDKVDHKWSMLIDHSEIDYINMYLGELEAFIKTRDKTNALAKLSSLKLLVKHIPDKEYPSLKNIL